MNTCWRISILTLLGFCLIVPSVKAQGVDFFYGRITGPGLLSGAYDVEINSGTDSDCHVVAVNFPNGTTFTQRIMDANLGDHLVSVDPMHERGDVLWGAIGKAVAGRLMDNLREDNPGFTDSLECVVLEFKVQWRYRPLDSPEIIR